MLRIYLNTCLVAFGLHFSTPHCAANPEPDDAFFVQSWDTENGLPHGAVTAVARSTDGYLWVGTRGGLARFDGVRFKQFTKATVPTLETDSIQSMVADPRGGVWVGTRDGILLRANGEEFEAVDLRFGTNKAPITSISIDGAETVWVATSGRGVIRIRGAKQDFFDQSSGLESDKVSQILCDGSNHTWALARGILTVFMAIGGHR